MHALLIAVSLAATPVERFGTPDEAAVALAGQLPTGSLLFSDGDCFAVRAFTGSPYTHVTGVVVEEGKTFVYDSQNGVGVRRLTLAKYLATTYPVELHVLQPAASLDEDRAKRFRSFLDSQLGRPYSVSHHLTGNRCEGLHCAEYMIDALAAADVAQAERPPRVSPASLRKGLLRHDLYVETRVLGIDQEDADRPAGGNWCHALWLDTRDCCSTCWHGFRRCVLCR